jgi:hypothetical protein
MLLYASNSPLNDRVKIRECCGGMRLLIEEGCIKPNFAPGADPGTIQVVCRNYQTRSYDLKYCPYCAKEISIIDN